MEVGKIKIIYESNEQNCTTESVVPYEVASFLLKSLIGWDEEWTCSFKQHNEFLESRDKFLNTSEKTEQSEVNNT